MPNLAGAVGQATGALTNRERQIAALVSEGLANKEIARRLSLSERTVETHVASVCNKLGFRSRVQIATWVAQQHVAIPSAIEQGHAAPVSSPVFPPWPVLAIMTVGIAPPIVAVAYQWLQSPPATPADTVLDILVTIAALGLLVVPAVALLLMKGRPVWSRETAIDSLLWIGAAVLALAAWELGRAWLSTGAIKPADAFEVAYSVLVLPLLLIHVAALVAHSRGSTWATPLITICAAFWILRFGYGLALATLVLWQIWSPFRTQARLMK